MRLTLTKHAEYALRILVWLAQMESGGGSASPFTAMPTATATATAAVAAAPAGEARRRQGPGAAGVAGVPAPVRFKAAEIVAGTGVPPVFATRILAQLQRQGMLTARAGQQGGYTLARSAHDVSLLDVIQSVEGPLVSQGCVLREGPCGGLDGRSTCVLHDAWTAAQGSLRAVLARTSLASAVGSDVAAVAVALGRAAPRNASLLPALAPAG